MERAAIVAESYEPGAKVVDVARRHGVYPTRLSSWRSAARARVAEAKPEMTFAEVTIASNVMTQTPAPHDGIEVVVGAIVIRLPKNATPRRITDIAQRLARQT